MNLIPAKTPWFLKKIASRYVWNIPTNEKIIYLTFDDGPTPKITEWVLDILNTYKAKATFFCIGKNVVNHPDIYKRILEENHCVGNHTHHHLKGWNTPVEKYIKNVKKASKHINSTLFRPPYGKITMSKSKKLRKLGYKIIMWDVVAIDWDVNVSQKKCANNVLKNVKKGSVVVFHDSLKAEKNMKYALKATLEHFSKAGYTFKTLI